MLINPDGEVLPISTNNFKSFYSSAKIPQSIKNLSVIISVTEIVQDFIDNDSLKVDAEELNILSREEQELLFQLKEEAIMTLIIENEEKELSLLDKEEKANAKDSFIDVITSKQYKQIVDTPKNRTVSLINKFTEYDTKKIHLKIQDQSGFGSFKRASNLS